MLNFFKKIKAKENLSTNSSDLYSRTHPLTNDRMLRIKNRIAELNISDFKQYNIELQENFKYIKIKFDTFLADFPEDLLEKYTSNNNFDLYGIAIINHRLGNSKKAIKLIDKLIKKDNDNPFFIELKAQFYYESGKAYKALENFQLATILRPNDPLFKIQIAESIISLANKNFYNLAFNNIQSALLIEYDNAYAWKKLSEIYSLNNQSNLSDLALAEHYYYSAKYEEALFLAEKILNIFNKDQTLYSTQNITRAKEIIDFSNKKLDKNN